MSVHTEEFYQINLKSDCIHHFPIGLIRFRNDFSAYSKGHALQTGRVEVVVCRDMQRWGTFLQLFLAELKKKTSDYIVFVLIK